MANPRRSSYSNNNQSLESPFQYQSPSFSSLSFVKHLLKKPHAFPFLLLLLLLLTWVSLRLQYSSSPRHLQQWRRDDGEEEELKANLVRFKLGLPSPIVKDKRGWLLDPVSIALQIGLKGPISCFALCSVIEDPFVFPLHFFALKFWMPN